MFECSLIRSLDLCSFVRMFAELERTLEHKFRSYYKHKDRILAEFENRTLENPIEKSYTFRKIIVHNNRVYFQPKNRILSAMNHGP